MTSGLYYGQLVLCILSFIVLYWHISRNQKGLWVVPVVCVMHVAWWLLTGDTSLLFFIGILLVGFLYRLPWSRWHKQQTRED